MRLFHITDEFHPQLDRGTTTMYRGSTNATIPWRPPEYHMTLPPDFWITTQPGEVAGAVIGFALGGGLGFYLFPDGGRLSWQSVVTTFFACIGGVAGGVVGALTVLGMRVPRSFWGAAQPGGLTGAIVGAVLGGGVSMYILRHGKPFSWRYYAEKLAICVATGIGLLAGAAIGSLGVLWIG